MGKAGILEPLNEYVEKSESLKWDDFVDSTVERNTLEGTVYAIPQVADVQTTIYNKEILADLGFANPPATIDEFIDYCVKAKEADYLPKMCIRDRDIPYIFRRKAWTDSHVLIQSYNPGLACKLIWRKSMAG